MQTHQETQHSTHVHSESQIHNQHGLGLAFNLVLLVMGVLLAGAATRRVVSHLRLPYTVLMLLLGILVGLGSSYFSRMTGMALFTEGLLVSPHVIIFVFLPTLIFESAFNMDGYKFNKFLGTIVLLAGPVLVLSTCLTASLMMAVTFHSWHWNWITALVFGALISATDPVAVVAILSELGVSKNLSILIEGESLLNDGTAIVLFSVFLALLTQPESHFQLGAALLSFSWVVMGGILLGLILAWLISFWLSKTFNDAPAEITLTLVLAFAAMLLAEGLLHVSGVMAIVVAGLWMGSRGKTKISPEIQSFLHKFWEMLAYIANTLIFFLVGMVVAFEFERLSSSDIILIILTYLGIMIIRFAVTLAVFPLFKRTGPEVPFQDALVSSWGGLRGAVSLALALMIYENLGIAEPVRQQILLVTVCVVLLTISINGSTVGFLLEKLGYKKTLLSESIGSVNAEKLITQKVQKKIATLAQEPDLKTVNWFHMEADLVLESQRQDEQLKQLLEKNQAVDSDEQRRTTWCQVLEIERRAYWNAFREGTLSPSAVLTLVRELDIQIEQIGHGVFAVPPNRAHLGPFRARMAQLFRKVSRLNRNFQFENMTLLYELSYAEARAARKVLEDLHVLEISETLKEACQKTYQTYLLHGKRQQEDIRTNLPELAQSIETRLARRMALNEEREMIYHLMRNGILPEQAGQKALASVEGQMQKLLHYTRQSQVSEPQKLLQELPLFKGLSEVQLKDLAACAEEIILAPHEFVFQENDSGNSLFFVIRGVLNISRIIDGKCVLLDVIGGGSLFGEMAFLTGESRSASIQAVSAVSLLKLSHDVLQDLSASYPHILETIWKAYAKHTFDNLLSQNPVYAHLEQHQRLAWIEEAKDYLLKQTEVLNVQNFEQIFLYKGQLESGGKVIHSPSLFRPGPESQVTALTQELRLMALKRAAF